MIFFVITIVFGYASGEPLNFDFEIVLPMSATVLGTRFLCTILMHLQVEHDVSQGLRMMKYSTNHRSKFVEPNSAFAIGLMQTLGGIAAEFFCIIFLCSLEDPIEIIIRFIAFASIAKVDDFYANALPSGNRVKLASNPIVIKIHRATSRKPGIRLL